MKKIKKIKDKKEEERSIRKILEEAKCDEIHLIGQRKMINQA